MVKQRTSIFSLTSICNSVNGATISKKTSTKLLMICTIGMVLKKLKYLRLMGKLSLILQENTKFLLILSSFTLPLILMVNYKVYTAMLLETMIL